MTTTSDQPEFSRDVDDDPPSASARPGARSAKTTGQKWARWIHAYTSMIALVIVLFFGITGLTLNHPDWTFGDAVELTTVEGVLPFAATTESGGVDFLAVTEFLRTTHGVDGTIDDYGASATTATIVYKDPGYLADASVDITSGAYEVTIEQQGFVAVMNDLHKGRDTGDGWRWVIDVSAALLVAISISGLGLQLFLRRRRRSALIIAAVGCLITVMLIVLTV